MQLEYRTYYIGCKIYYCSSVLLFGGSALMTVISMARSKTSLVDLNEDSDVSHTSIHVHL